MLVVDVNEIMEWIALVVIGTYVGRWLGDQIFALIMYLQGESK